MESFLKQLPHWTPAIDKGLRKRGFTNILQLNFLNEEQLKETLNEVYAAYSEDHSHLITPLDDDGVEGGGSNNSKKKPKKKDPLEDILPPRSLANPQEVAQMAEDAEACIRMYPFIKMAWCARTFDETEIYNDDIVKVQCIRYLSVSNLFGGPVRGKVFL